MSQSYARRRRADYPDMGAQLDAIAKGFAHLRSAGTSLPQATLDWLDTLQAVKDAHKKLGDET